eukprot:3681503-Pyramimonas_sp.AAC.1
MPATRTTTTTTTSPAWRGAGSNSVSVAGLNRVFKQAGTRAAGFCQSKNHTRMCACGDLLGLPGTKAHVRASGSKSFSERGAECSPAEGRL